MAGRGISIDILANVRDALKGTGDVEQALGDIESTLEDMARSGDQSVDKMSRGFRDLARKSDDTADKMERSYKDAYRDIRRAADDTADDSIRAQRRMGEQSEEIGGEIRQNLGEGIANAARGDFESLADTIGDTLGGITAGIGGIGYAALGIAGAFGLGAIVATIQTITEQSEQMAEAVKGHFQEMASEGVAAWESTQSQMQRLSEAYSEHEGEIKRIAELTGLNFETVASAWAGNKDAIDTVNRAYGEQVDALKDVPGATKEATDATIRGWEGIMGPLNNTLEAYDLAKEKAQQFADQQSDDLLKLLDGYGKVALEIDEVGNKVVELPDGTRILIEADTGKATLNLDKFKGDADDVIDHVSNREARILLKADTRQALRDARRAIGEISRETATITINGKFGRRFGG